MFVCTSGDGRQMSRPSGSSNQLEKPTRPMLAPQPWILAGLYDGSALKRVNIWDNNSWSDTDLSIK